jgi:hypothetical protein
LGKNLESRKITHYLYGVLARTTKCTYNAEKSQDYTLKPQVKKSVQHWFSVELHVESTFPET